MFWAPWSRGDAELLVETKEKLGKKKDLGLMEDSILVLSGLEYYYKNTY